MSRAACAAALWCALAVAAAAFTVDCNHEYTDCDTELSKLTEDEDAASTLSHRISSVIEAATPENTTSTTTTTLGTTTREQITTENITETPTFSKSNDATESKVGPKPRLLNVNVDDLQNFAIAIHNQTKGRKALEDLSDVNMDNDDEDEPPMLTGNDSKTKHITDKFYNNLQAPFNPMIAVDKSEEIETCKENEITYKVGERIDRGCEETCECSPGGVFECSPRCKQPFIRRGRRLNDPLCFESPVDECCSIIACATGNGEMKPAALEVCRYGNNSYPVGGKWNIGCDQTCTCEEHSVVTCKPRCKRLPPSDKCINVQDPHDECCEVQICDVSQDVHEEPIDNSTSTTSTTTPIPKELQELINPQTTYRPLVLIEPIGSVKVLQNNSVQINLMHLNKSDDPIHLLLSSDGGKSYNDVELKYSNLILNLEGGKDYVVKTKETGTKFNFTITASDVGNEVPVEETFNMTKDGCYHDGEFYGVGDEFQIGCTELCECTGPDTRECAPLICPSHVGLELVSKGCVRWAPNPPPQPPNCCPRTARCLSDGTCHYNGVPIQNWSEVPLELTGCEQHCFCENGELDCQEACNPLPPLPPQSLRCPPQHRPAPVNISDDDCCKQWGCLPNAGNMNTSTFQTNRMPHIKQMVVNYVTPITPALPSFITYLNPTPAMTTETNSFRDFNSVMKTHENLISNNIYNTSEHDLKKSFEQVTGTNITVFTPGDTESLFKTILPEPPMVTNNVDWETKASHSQGPVLSHHFVNIHSNLAPDRNLYRKKLINEPDSKLHDFAQVFKYDINNNALKSIPPNSYKQIHDSPALKKVPLSQFNNLNYFLPANDKMAPIQKQIGEIKSTNEMPMLNLPYSDLLLHMKTNNVLGNVRDKTHPFINEHPNHNSYDFHGKRVTIMQNKDMMAGLGTKIQLSKWRQGPDTHLITKNLNPYETVLHKVSSNLKELPMFTRNTKNISKIHSKTYSSLDFEHLLNKMEIESEVNRNTGRSVDKIHSTSAAGQSQPGLPAKPPSHGLPPPFLPTIPPEDRYPEEDIPDYTQNNIHRPVNPLVPSLPGLPPGIPIQGYGDENKKLAVLSLQGDSPTSIKMLFGLPPVLVGLRGSVDLRYTDSANEDISQWYSQVFAPADEVLTTPRLEFQLTGLKPSTVYKIRGKLYLHNLPVEPESEIYTVRTQDLPTVLPPEEKRRKIDGKLTVVDVNDTTAHVSWRHFTEEELQFIDGIQVRYRPKGTPIFSMTELLHHGRSTADLHDLHPGTTYEASLVLIPPPRATTELYDSGNVEFSTTPYIDPYNWTVTVEVKAVGSEAVEMTWRGIPVPAERWVRVYRAAHACGERKREHDAFRLAARDLPPAITLTGLDPDAKCRVWLELFLTNGKVKTSNVLDVHTKSLDSSEPIDNVIEASSVAGSRGPPRGDYYGALVVVGVVAALAALTSVLLLLVVVRRHRPRSVPITSPRESSLPPYDNPAYKLELQQETMDL
ncbi:putative epidermal cell surface receptor isoform X3 [Bicyclus anynana]|uniref:Epidermal cell surface receptor isoform X3 n=1 Tax=Bicyclus anynana TaxID=110368 RepID=A0ABM3LYF0_BICAN|nr:putative epidermal cell surface receptor isoform X3 [Bicyclus anynana]